jgi:Fic family protein
MSAFFEANKDDYYKKLMNARLKNDFSDWIMFFLRGVEQRAIDTASTRLAFYSKDQ